MTNKSGAIGTRTELVVHVNGIPAPQGSKSFKGMRAGKPVLVESSKKVAPWREVVAMAAVLAMFDAGWVTLDCPALLEVVFFLPPPKTMPKGRTEPTTYPDLSKLVRSTEDALVSAGVVKDDARFVQTVSEKRYATARPPGAVIRICPLPPSERHGERRNPLGACAAMPELGPDGERCPYATAGGALYLDNLRRLGPSPRTIEAAEAVCTCGKHKLESEMHAVNSTELGANVGE